MAERALLPFPGNAAPDIGLKTTLTRVGSDVLKIDYVVTGSAGTIALPPPAMAERTDGLWQHSCFEAFVRLAGNAYVEFNFAPSRQWASYRFDDYRAGMRPAIDLPAPDIYLEIAEDRIALTAWVDAWAFHGDIAAIGLSAVIEEVDGRKSWWALAHPPGKPDFHHPDCFVLQLPAAG